MDCVSCGSTQRDIAKFCDQCGHALVAPQVAAPTDFAKTFPAQPPVPKRVRGTLQQKFAAMGTLAGRYRAEIESVVGPPNSMALQPPDTVLLQWLDQLWWSGEIAYQIGLIFDKNGVCGGVTVEISNPRAG